jgi:hypothetical protein
MQAGGFLPEKLNDRELTASNGSRIGAIAK